MRRKKFYLNSITALLKQLVFIICGLVLPKYILDYYGSSVNGLVTSITQFLGFITFLEMGIGPVIQSNLYKPLAHKDTVAISEIVSSSEKFFNKIVGIFLVYIAILVCFFPKVVNNGFDFFFTGSLILIISISTFSQYYFGITYQLLLNADQKSYIQNTLQIVTMVLSTVISIALIKIGVSIHTVKLSTAFIYMLRPIGQMIYVHKRYEINNKTKYVGEPIKQKWNGFAQHVAAVVVQNTDVTILSLFSTLENVSIYSVYYNVVYGVNSVVMTAVTGLESLWGNMLANNENDKLVETFDVVEWVMHFGCSFLFAVTGIMIVPFVRIYTTGITDANYITPIFGALIVMAYGMQCLRVPYFRVIKAAGHYKETQNGSIVQMIINLVLSVILVFKFGLNGVAIGTFVAMFYHTIYFAWYLRKNILFREFSIFLKYVCIDIISVVGCVIATRWITLETISYMSWVFMAIKVSLISVLIISVANIVGFRENINKFVHIFIQKRH